MVEVDTVHTIKRPYSLIHISKGVLDHPRIGIPGEFPENIWNRLHVPSAYQGENDLLRHIYTRAAATICEAKANVGRHDRYKTHENILAEHICDAWKGRIPIFLNGYAVTQRGGKTKEWLDPFSPSSIPTNDILELTQETNPRNSDSDRTTFPQKFLEQFAFWNVSPVDFPLVFGKGGAQGTDAYGLEYLLLDQAVPHWNENGIERSDLRKTTDMGGGRGIMRASPELYDADMSMRMSSSMPEEFMNAMKERGCLNAEEYRAHRLRETYLAREITALRLAHLCATIWEEAMRTVHDYGTARLPLFMEKTSISGMIMQSMQKYARSTLDIPITFEFIGGTQGPMQTANRTKYGYTAEGITHQSAKRRIIGYLRQLQRQWQSEPVRAGKRTATPPPVPFIDYTPSQKYPFLLLEPEARDTHPNMEDVFEQNLTPLEQELLAGFARAKRIGYKRREARTVEFMLENPSIYNGFRTEDKSNRKWHDELYGKTIIFPHQLKGITWPLAEKIGEFRGSEFTLPTQCTLERAIGAIEEQTSRALLREIIKELPAEARAEFSKFYRHETLESIPVLIGTAAHTLSSSTLTGLAHYSTLKRIGLETTPSDLYTEWPFFMQALVPLEEHGARAERAVQVSFHPDEFFFLRDSDGRLDTCILDIKNKRVIPYPEHKYLHQTFFYGMMISHVLQEHGYSTANIYTCLDRNAFDKLFWGEEPHEPERHHTFRPQKFGPITKFEPGHQLYTDIPRMIARMVSEKEALRAGTLGIGAHKQAMEEANECARCYQEHRYLCDRLRDEEQAGKNVLRVLNTIRT